MSSCGILIIVPIKKLSDLNHFSANEQAEVGSNNNKIN